MNDSSKRADEQKVAIRPTLTILFVALAASVALRASAKTDVLRTRSGSVVHWAASDITIGFDASAPSRTVAPAGATVRLGALASNPMVMSLAAQCTTEPLRVRRTSVFADARRATLAASATNRMVSVGRMATFCSSARLLESFMMRRGLPTGGKVRGFRATKSPKRGQACKQ